MRHHVARDPRPHLPAALSAAFLLAALLALPLAATAQTAASAPQNTTPNTPPAANQDAPSPSLELMAGQMLLVGFRGTHAGPDANITRLITDLHLGGVILFDYDVALKQRGRNITSPDQLQALTAQLQATARSAGLPPLFIGVDQEGGKVQRLKERDGFLGFPSAAELGGAGTDTSATLAFGQAMGSELAAMGVNVDFAPVLDVNVNPECPVIGALGRSFSADPAVVALHGGALLRGLRQSNILGCVKHFPGHGSAASDSHTGLPDITATWSPIELAPYATLIQSGLVDLVMTAHLFNANLDPEHPATLSPAVVGGILRQELGYGGVVVTDDLNMGAIAQHYGLREAIRLAVLAGCDLLLFGNNLAYDPDLAARAHAILVDLVQSGELPLERIQESYDRILALKARL